MLNNNLLAIANPALSSDLAGMTNTAFMRFLLQGLIKLGFIAGALIFLFMFIYGGIRLASSGGDKSAVASAKSILANAVVGAVILFSLFAIVNLFGCFFGVDIKLIKFDTLNISFTPMGVSQCITKSGPVKPTPTFDPNPPGPTHLPTPTFDPNPPGPTHPPTPTFDPNPPGPTARTSPTPTFDPNPPGPTAPPTPTFDPNPPGPVVCIMPSSLSGTPVCNGTSSDIRWSWGAVSGTTQYQLQTDREGNFNPADRTLNMPSIPFPNPPTTITSTNHAFNVDVYGRVRVIQSTVCNFDSAWRYPGSPIRTLSCP